MKSEAIDDNNKQLRVKWKYLPAILMIGYRQTRSALPPPIITLSMVLLTPYFPEVTRKTLSKHIKQVPSTRRSKRASSGSTSTIDEANNKARIEQEEEVFVERGGVVLNDEACSRYICLAKGLAFTLVPGEASLQAMTNIGVATEKHPITQTESPCIKP
ncbi:hypothetical protein BDA99DRAFT_533400 [Phascolomyces articulosus]|uniref:Uncharacterized protein n=1 Tax=Phascolomyces articulosus TaxID=60185 RepID=A0AAD5PK62_9FUNG|nr:hypothetical protein BDA99DRAFT_533400 [Phascolomyces articulosus]